MVWLAGIGFFVFGTIIGSFLNVVILRYNTGRRVTGRSSCSVCKKTLRWHELVPVASFLVQRGRCRSCRSGISPQYPLVEVLTGVLFLGVFLKLFVFGSAGFSLYYSLLTTYYLLVVSLLVVITAYDARHKIIPDPFVFALVVLAGLMLFVSTSFSFTLPSLWHALAGPLLAAPFALLWVLSHGRWMGLGDAKLAWAVGWFLGLLPGVTALLLAFWSGAIVSVVLLGMGSVSKDRLFLGRWRFTIKSEIPFAPFIVLGALIVFFFGFDITVFLGLAI